MDFSVEPHSWADFPSQFLWYFGPMSLVHLYFMGAGAIVIRLCSPYDLREEYLRKLYRFCLFNLLFVTISAIANGVWGCFVWGRLYFSTDYIFDFMPFWPIRQSVIDAPFGEVTGELFGITMLELQALWLVFAVATWTGTILTYRRLIRRREVSKNLEGIGRSSISPVKVQ